MKLIGPINQRRYLKPDEAAKICVQVAVGELYADTTGQLIEDGGIMKLNKHCLDDNLREVVIELAKKVTVNK